MLRRGFARFLIIALLLLGLVTVAGYFGWSQGYDAGLAEAAGEGATTFGPIANGFAAGFFGAALFFKLLFFVFLFFMITRIFFFWRHKPWRGHHDASWSNHHHEDWHGRGRRGHHHRGHDEEEVTQV